MSPDFSVGNVGPSTVSLNDEDYQTGQECTIAVVTDLAFDDQCRRKKYGMSGIAAVQKSQWSTSSPHVARCTIRRNRWAA